MYKSQQSANLDVRKDTDSKSKDTIEVQGKGKTGNTNDRDSVEIWRGREDYGRRNENKSVYTHHFCVEKQHRELQGKR